MDVLCVTCAKVKFGSILTTFSSREMLESFHLFGRRYFQLEQSVHIYLVIGLKEQNALDQSQVQLLKPHQPTADLLSIRKINRLLQKESGNLAQ